VAAAAAGARGAGVAGPAPPLAVALPLCPLTSELCLSTVDGPVSAL